MKPYKHITDRTTVEKPMPPATDSTVADDLMMMQFIEPATIRYKACSGCGAEMGPGTGSQGGLCRKCRQERDRRVFKRSRRQ
jgi:NADH pyrophosphatase NudC (nudix superfamily)